MKNLIDIRGLNRHIQRLSKIKLDKKSFNHLFKKTVNLFANESRV